MAKINLLTIHWGKCYGAVMQTYATCQLLEKAGHEVCVINLIHPKIKEAYRNPRKWVDLYREFQFFIFKYKFFSKLSKKVYKVDYSKLPDADYYVVGSDQVWNKDITSPFYLDYYLSFVPNSKKRIALSSSFGKAEWNENYDLTKDIYAELMKFHAISIREDSGKEILSKTFDIQATQLLDPTLGYGQFESLLKHRKRKKQIFPFLFQNTKESKDIVTLCSEYLKIPIYRSTRFKSYFKNGPLDWLSNIANSDFIITDSFHGLALSLIFNKQFIVLCADLKKFTRLQSLLRLFNLEERFISSYSDLSLRKNILYKKIDYTTINEILKNEQHRYELFIFQKIHHNA